MRDLVISIIFLAAIFLGMPFAYYVFHIGSPEPFADLPLNNRGDFLAGIFGPLAFFAAAVAVVFQAKELSAQREQLKRQADEAGAMNEALRVQIAENSVFEMLRTHNDVVNAFDLHNRKEGRIIAQGRDCFVVCYRFLNKAYRKKLKSHNDRTALYYAYKDLYRVHANDLGHYFRFLYNSFRYIDEMDEAVAEKAGKLFRAQLSDTELLLLYYNCLSDNGEKFIHYAKKFEIFDNMPTVKLLNFDHSSILPKEVFGSNPMYNHSRLRKREKHILSQLR